MSCQIMIIGEAWGEYEERALAPFVGPSGYELTRMLSEAKIHRADCYLTNVFNLRPRPTNAIENLFQKTKVGDLPPLKAGHYLQTCYYRELDRLYHEVRTVKPNICILLGNTALWAMCRVGGISKIRGTVTTSTVISGQKVLPTYHPAAILREWSLRPVTVLDLFKAGREAHYPEIRRPERTVYIEPSLEDLEWFYNEHLVNAKEITFDIETSGDAITCIGFAPSASVAMVIPFHDPRRANGSFWETLETEQMAWNFVRRVLALPQPKSGQNTLYDINFLWKKYGMWPNNYEDDTMLLHHALQPESEKGLAFLGSVYTNESSWKLLRQKKTATIKKDN